MQSNPYEFAQSGQPYGSTQLQPAPLKHSGFGIASFLIAIGMGILEFVLFAAAGVMASAPNGIDENSPVAAILGLAVIGGLMMVMLAIVLGIAGLLQAQRKKVFAILGVMLGTIVLLGVVGLIGLGLAVQAAESAGTL